MTNEEQFGAASGGQLAETDIADWDRVADVYAASAGGPQDRVYAMLRDGLWSSLGPDVALPDSALCEAVRLAIVCHQSASL
jgi:hypothetical protein